MNRTCAALLVVYVLHNIVAYYQMYIMCCLNCVLSNLYVIFVVYVFMVYYSVSAL